MIQSFNNTSPVIHPTAYIAESSTLIGEVTVAQGASIWPSAVLRGDMGSITIGMDTSVQDGSVIHMSLGINNVIVGERVTIGHNVVLHGCSIENECLIGMGTLILDNCHIGQNSFIAAGSLLTPGTQIPPNSFVLGSPAKVTRTIREKEMAMIKHGFETYREISKLYRTRDA